MWWDYILSYCSNHKMFPGKTNPKQTGQKQRCWQLRPTKQEKTSKEITVDVLNWVLWKKDTTHLCDPETLGCCSSFSAWVKAMTLSPRAKATKALHARMEHLDMRVQLLIDSSLDTMTERWQVCWRERRIKKDGTVSHRSITSGFQSPVSSAETTELQTGFYQPPATSHYGEKGQ